MSALGTREFGPGSPLRAALLLRPPVVSWAEAAVCDTPHRVTGGRRNPDVEGMRNMHRSCGTGTSRNLGHRAAIIDNL
jgi:hypothetical protein